MKESGLTDSDPGKMVGLSSQTARISQSGKHLREVDENFDIHRTES